MIAWQWDYIKEMYFVYQNDFILTAYIGFNATMISLTASFVTHVSSVALAFFLKDIFSFVYIRPCLLVPVIWKELHLKEKKKFFTLFFLRSCQQVIDITLAHRNGLGPCEGPVNEPAPDLCYSWTHTTLCYYWHPLSSDASYLQTYYVTSCSIHLFTPVGSSSLIWLNKVGH